MSPYSISSPSIEQTRLYLTPPPPGGVGGGEEAEVAAGQPRALGDVAVRDLLAGDRADPLVLDPPAVGGVHLVEADVLVLGRRVELDPDADQTERDRAAPDRAHVHSPSPGSGRTVGRARRIGAALRLRQHDRADLLRPGGARGTPHAR